jgi:oxygen-independent coproporphyrinogen-3 oxidase
MAEDLALYIHWPFCVSKCPYCDFNSHVRESIDQQVWREALLADLAHEAALLPGRRLTSIFFGGGTPSLMDPATAEALIAAAKRHWAVNDDIEITLEANPPRWRRRASRTSPLRGSTASALGCNRSTTRPCAFSAEPTRPPRASPRSTSRRSSSTRVSFDLIYACPASRRRWQAMLTRALALGTGHLSLYQLTIEPGTASPRSMPRGKLAPSTRRSADLFELTGEMTAAAACRSTRSATTPAGEESRHNLTYWRYGDYAGHRPRRARPPPGPAHRPPSQARELPVGLARNGHGIVEEAPAFAIEAADERW